MTDLSALKFALEKSMRTAKGPQFATIDFDNTCIVNDIAEACLAYMCERGLIRDRSLLADGSHQSEYGQQIFRHYYTLLSTGSFRDAYRLCAKIFAGCTPEEASAIVSAAIAEEGTTISKRELFGVSIQRGLRVRPVIRDLLVHISHSGIQLWIVSASPEVAVRSAMRHFEIPGTLLAVRAQLKDGLLTTSLLEPAPIAEKKVDCIKEFVHPTQHPLFAAGDSMNDFPMLQYATSRLVVDRGNELTREAKRLDWPTLVD